MSFRVVCVNCLMCVWTTMVVVFDCKQEKKCGNIFYIVGIKVKNNN